MILICRTCPDWSCERQSKTQGCDYAVVEVTADLLIHVDQLIDQYVEVATSGPWTLYTLRVWDFDYVDYLDSLPKEWDEWAERHLLPWRPERWVELPFPYDRDSKTIRLGRLEEAALFCAGDEGVFWKAQPAGCAYNIDTPCFPELTPLEQLATSHTES